jgi:hypothetical protein
MKKEYKKDLLKSLIGDMKEMSRKDKFKGMKKPSEEEGMMKATIVADSPEGLKEGADKLPEVMDKAESFMQARMGKKKEDKSKK